MSDLIQPEPQAQAQTDIGHLIPVEIWDMIDHEAAQNAVPDPDEVAEAHRLIGGLS